MELLLKTDGSFTLFAPDNQAFAEVPADKLSDPAALKQVYLLPAPAAYSVSCANNNQRRRFPQYSTGVLEHARMLKEHSLCSDTDEKIMFVK